jgi:hypothetical protein
MATNYSPKHFLRQVPNPLLKAFFDRRRELTEVAWDKLGEMDADPVFEAWQALPEKARAEVERTFRSVSDLSSAQGLQTLIEKGQFHRVDLNAGMNQLRGLHEKVFWVYLNHERVPSKTRPSI